VRQLCLATLITFVVAVGADLTSAALADARAPTQPHGNPIKRDALSAIERRAISIKSISAAGDGSLGLVVSVTFDGDVERYLGQADLKLGLLGLVLGPAVRAHSPAAVLDERGGFTPASVPSIVGAGRHLTAQRATVDVFSREQTAHINTSRPVWVVRSRDQVVFYISSPPVSPVAQIELRVFARSPIGPGRLTPVGWRRVLVARPTARASLRLDSTALSKPQLTNLRAKLSALLSVTLRPELRRELGVRASLKTVLANYARLGRVIKEPPGLRHVSKRDLLNDYVNAAQRARRLNSEIAEVQNLGARVAVRVDACAHPSPIPSTAPPSPAAPVVVVQTDRALCQALNPQLGLGFSNVRPQSVPVIDVNDQMRYQRFSGLGAAMTDSSAWLIHDQLSPSARGQLMHDVFGSPGIHLNFLRVPMAASDFTVSPQPYSYDDVPAGQSDPSLSRFSIGHDPSYISPALREALVVNPGLEILATPWSPPAWMKSNDSLDNINRQGTLLPGARSSLASYFVKFIQAYAGQGVPIDAITPQNEPTVATPYPGLTLPEVDEAQFISQDLQPALAAAGLHPKIYGWDAGWDLPDYPAALVAGPAGAAITGIAWHCYFGSPAVMSQLHDAGPGLDQIVDECSPEIRRFGTPEFLISSLRNWASAVAVWNLALDPKGQPKLAANSCPGCRGLVTIDEHTHGFQALSGYFQLGQVSSFVQPGATRIDSRTFVGYGTDPSNVETVSAGLDDVAFLNPDGSKVLIAYNNSLSPIAFAVGSDGSYFAYTIPPRAMTTFTWR
jgi:glucosylceramidase